MRTYLLAPLALLVCACHGEGPATTSAGDETTEGASSSSGGPPEVTTGADEPGTATGGTSTGADVPVDGCPETVAAPPDCGPVPGTCGGATPIAGGGAAFVRGTALTRDDVWFLMQTSGCPEGLYRAAKRGGDAQRVRDAAGLLDFEADDDAVYLVERTADPYTMRVRAWVDGVETVLGETHGDPRYNTYFNTWLTRTLSGVLTFDTGGAQHPPFLHLTPGGMSVVGHAVDDAYLGSHPAHDGQRLYYSLSDPPALDDDDLSLDRLLVGVADGASVVLAEDALARGLPTVAVDAEYVYFATGDPLRVDGVQPAPMGVSRVARSGGPAVPLFPAADIFIDQVLVDDTEVFFRQAPLDIFAVAKSGGTPRRVWHGEHASTTRIQQDASDLYFAVSAPFAEIPVPGRDFIVRVDKATVLP